MARVSQGVLDAKVVPELKKVTPVIASVRHPIFPVRLFSSSLKSR